MSHKSFTLRIPDEVKENLEFISTMTKRSQSSIALEAMSKDLAVSAKRLRMPCNL